MICPGCGKKIKEESKFCVYCGTEQIASVQYNEDDKKVSSRNKKTAVIVVCALVAVIITGLIFSLVYFFSGKDHDDVPAENSEIETVNDTEAKPASESTEIEASSQMDADDEPVDSDIAGSESEETETAYLSVNEIQHSIALKENETEAVLEYCDFNSENLCEKCGNAKPFECESIIPDLSGVWELDNELFIFDGNTLLVSEFDAGGWMVEISDYSRDGDVYVINGMAYDHDDPEKEEVSIEFSVEQCDGRRFIHSGDRGDYPMFMFRNTYKILEAYEYYHDREEFDNEYNDIVNDNPDFFALNQ